MRVLVVVKRRSEARLLVAILGSPSLGLGGPVKVVAVAPRGRLPPPPPPPWDPGAWSSAADLTAAARNDAERLASQLASTIPRSRVASVETAVRVGTPRHEIIAAAVEWSAELTVLAIGGSALEVWQDTRLARAVVARAPSSVLVVRSLGERSPVRSLLGDALPSERELLRSSTPS